MTTFYMVTLNGHPLKRWLEKAEAEAMAERWQGSRGGYHGGSGLLKQADRGDHVEVRVDREANKEFNERYKVAKAGDLQTVHYEQRAEEYHDADAAMRR